MPSISVEYNMECNKEGMPKYLHSLRHLESRLLSTLIYFFSLFLPFKGLGQVSVNAEKVTQEKNVIVVHLGIGAIQTACVVTVA